MKYQLHVLICVLALTLLGVGGCAEMQKIFGPQQVDPVTNEVTEDSAAIQAAEGLLPFLPPPWGELALLTLTTIQNGFLAKKKYSEHKKKKSEPAPA